MVASLRALLRRPGNLLGRRIAFGKVMLDPEDRQVLIQGVAQPSPCARNGSIGDAAPGQRQGGH